MMKKVYSHFSANHIPLEPFPFRMELAMEGYLMENEDVLSLGDEAYYDVEILEAELSVAKLKGKGKGRIDLLAFYDSHIFGIVELKLGEVSIANLRQIQRYFDSREEIFNRHKNRVEGKFEDSKWIAVLIGNSVSKDLQGKIERNEAWVDDTVKPNKSDDKIPLCAIALQRYRGDNGQVFVMTETFVPGTLEKNEKDKTRYEFKGQTYNKRNLAYSVVLEISGKVENFQQLEKILPNSVQGTKLGVFTRFSEAETYESEHGGRRYFMDDPIQLKDGTRIAVCNQWGIDNIPKLLAAVKESRLDLPPVVIKKQNTKNQEES